MAKNKQDKRLDYRNVICLVLAILVAIVSIATIFNNL